MFEVEEEEEEAEPQACPVLPDNLRAFQVFIRCNRQWVYAPSGHRVSHRSEVVPALMDLLGVPADERLDVFDQVEMLAAATMALDKE